jgi:hypothetical protein
MISASHPKPDTCLILNTENGGNLSADVYQRTGRHAALPG